MNLLDTNGVSFVLEHNFALKEQYFLAPEVFEEVEMTQLKFGKATPANIAHIDRSDHFEEGRYLARYRSALNKFSGKSFYNMTGFGDISILAVVQTVLELFDAEKATQLFDPTEPIVVFTDDTGLTNRIGSEFTGRDVSVRKVSQVN